MSLRNDIENGFPAGIDFPLELGKFAKWAEAEKWALEGFELKAGDRSDVTAWFGHPGANARVGIFGEGPDGSMYAIWKDDQLEERVVFLGSEGEVRNLTDNFLDFLRLLAIGYGEIGYADLIEPPEDDLFMAGALSDDEFAPEADESLPEFRQWLQREYGVVIPPDALELINPEDKSFEEYVERMQLLHG